MSIIHTKRNLVAAYEPQAGDVAVVTRMGGAQTVQPIGEYDNAVTDAAAIADHMQHPINVVPVDVDEFLSLRGLTPEGFVRDLPMHALAALRQDMIDACLDALHHCDDKKVRAEAAATLVKLGVMK